MVCLSLSPPLEVDFGFWELIDDLPSYGEKIKKFREYVFNTWITNGSFPVSLWNHFENQGPRTNNHVEGFHSKIN